MSPVIPGQRREGTLGPAPKAAAGGPLRTPLKALGLAVALLAAGAAPAAADGSLLTVIDNSHADSVVEIDRAANVQYGSSGTAGSDHDGSAVDALEALFGGARRDAD
ncbi:hypothetical protein [Streptomyces sp. TLI_105]|uniref:hypothetical protein n=1 Tax=Streptomyces sp. TLI_105 TaxID=1881019 RepID=UPI00089C22FD|nr:hypothetical protein [Streptomyces sp. TLI_105]SED82631.1 hypothetical protein SAMN05428939_6383 [Streptomyces sp. TLI_105]